MAQIDKLKEEIGWLKVIFAILIATDISLIARLAQNYMKANPLFLKVGLTIAFLVTLVIVWINNVAYRKIDKLEELYRMDSNFRISDALVIFLIGIGIVVRKAMHHANKS